MDENESINEFIGFMVIALYVGMMLVGVGQLGKDPQVVAEIAGISPWLGAHVRILIGVAGGIIVIGGAAISFMSMIRGDDHSLVVIGSATAKLLIAVSILAFIASISFLLSVGWFCAKNIIAH